MPLKLPKLQFTSFVFVLTMPFFFFGCTNPNRTVPNVPAQNIPQKLALAAVRNGSETRLMVPGDPWKSNPSGIPREKEVDYIFRDKVFRELITKGYEIIPLAEFDEKIDIEMDNKGILLEDDVAKISGADATMFFTILYWDISNLNKSNRIDIAADVELRAKDGKQILWARNKIEKSVILEERFATYEMFIERFVQDSLKEIPHMKQ